ncbi:hypothetical protein ACWIGY_20225 [Streptomyces anulatus]
MVPRRARRAPRPAPGKFLEHIPEIDFKYDGSVERTAQIIADNGFEVDWNLWEADYGKCGPCRPGENCH